MGYGIPEKALALIVFAQSRGIPTFFLRRNIMLTQEQIVSNLKAVLDQLAKDRRTIGSLLSKIDELESANRFLRDLLAHERKNKNAHL
jgi:hypothetical protein